MRSQRSSVAWMVPISGMLVVFALRVFFPERSLTDIGPRALLDSLFALSLATLVLLIAAGLGQRTLRKIHGRNSAGLETAIFSLALGLGILAYGILGLGLAGWLKPLSIGAWLFIAALVGWPGTVDFCHQIKTLSEKLWSGLGSQPPIFKMGAFLGLLILLLILLNCLAPPSDYDGLMYHLRAPQLFLEAGRIILLDGIWQANGPATMEMLYTIGVAFGSGSFAQLIHLVFFLLFMAAGGGFFRKFLSKDAGLLPVLVLLGIPVLTFIASRSHSDFGWGLFEFLGVWALVNWLNKHQARWLLISGVMMGFALGTKYLAMGGASLLGGWVLLESRRSPSTALRNLLYFAIPALLIASPWYLKNWALGGNPVYPFLFPTPGWDATRSQLLSEYMYSFGTGRSLMDFLTLPVNLFTQHVRYSTFISIDAPGFLFPFALLYLYRRNNRLLNQLGLYSLCWFAIWSLGSQQTRFLIPVYPIWAMITAYQFLSLRSPLIKRVVPGALCAAMLVMTIIYQAADLLTKPIFGIVTGTASKAAYLEQAYNGFKAVEFLHRELPSGSRVLMLWDGRSYYCGSLCIPDSEEDLWVRLVSGGAEKGAISARLTKMGVTHLMVVNPSWHILYHDPGGMHRAAYAYLQDEYLPACTVRIYNDEVAAIYELHCISHE